MADSQTSHEALQSRYTLAQEQAIKEGRQPQTVSFCPLGESTAPKYITSALKLIHPDVVSSYFGCGLPCPHCVKGCKILDLGSGTGRDCFLLGYLAGPEGQVTGVDMTPAMVQKATEMGAWHAEKFGFRNVSFQQGYLESLTSIPNLQPASFDIVMKKVEAGVFRSNCVICLTKEKSKVYQQVYDLLKPGGELCFSNIYCETKVPEAVKNHKDAYYEGFGGAMAFDDFVTMTGKIGFQVPLKIAWSPYVATDLMPEVVDLTKNLKFFSGTLRLFKPDPSRTTEATTVRYRGTVGGCEDRLPFAQEYSFEKGEEKSVTSEIASALYCSRFASHFDFVL